MRRCTLLLASCMIAAAAFAQTAAPPKPEGPIVAPPRAADTAQQASGRDGTASALPVPVPGAGRPSGPEVEPIGQPPDTLLAPLVCIEWDDIETDGSYLTPVPGDYLGHCWSDLCTAGGPWYAELTQAIRDDYASGLPDVSSPNIAYNAFGATDCVIEFAGPVAVTFCQITRWPNAPGSDATEVRFIGTLAGNPVFDFTVPTVNDVWSPVNFGGAVIDRLVVTPPEGAGHWWLMDQLCLAEPGEVDCIKWNWDDIPTVPEDWIPVPGNYLGQCWSDQCTAGGRWYTIKTQAIRDMYGSGLADVSWPNVGFNGFGDTDCVIEFSGPLAVNFCQITRWPNVPGSDATEVRFIGSLGGAGVFDFTVPTTNEVWTPVDFGGVVIDKLVVTPPEGPGHWWVMDDLCVGPCDDATPPTADITSPGDFGCGCNPTEVIGTANDPDGAFGSYTLEYRKTGDPTWTLITTSTTPVINGTLANWDTTGLLEGWYLLRVTVENTCGLVSTDASIVRVSKQFDDLEVRAPVDGGIYGGIVCFDGTAWDNSCFDHYTVEYRPSGGGAWDPVDPGNPVYTSTVINDPLASWDTIGLGIPDGDYETLTQAFDDCGNAAVDRRLVTVDNTAPTALITDPVNCDEVDGVVQIIGTADDANLSSWVLQYTGGNVNGWVTIASGNTPVINDVLANWDTTGLPACAYTLRLRVSDEAVLNCNGAIHHHSAYMVSLSVGANGGCIGDLDGDGDIDLADLAALLAVYGTTCE